jgi:hypothetical protein
MGNKTKKLLIIALALVAVAAGGLAWTLSQPDKANTNKTNQSPAASPAKTTEQSIEPVAYDGQEGKNALELLQQHATVVTKDSSYGPYVDSINGVRGGANGKYWAFYVNGQMAAVGAADYATKPGDSIEWKFE